MPKTKTPKTAARVYRAASYARLSVDDESYGTSGSVLNQHAMIRDFADANGGLSIVAEYSDDGFSGSTFENRPGWGSLLADVETDYCSAFATPFHAPLLQRSMADCHTLTI